MREIDGKATEEFGISQEKLMDNAGGYVAEIAKGLDPEKTAVLCGSGNNGGDGLAAARYLKKWGLSVDIILLKEPESFKSLSFNNYMLAKSIEIPIIQFGNHDSFTEYSLIIDALLGTGINGTFSEDYQNAIEEINDSEVPVISADVPSGLNSDTGEVMGTAVKATTTVTFALPKKGLLIPKAKDYIGDLIIAQIGIPKELLDQYYTIA